MEPLKSTDRRTNLWKSNPSNRTIRKRKNRPSRAVARQRRIVAAAHFIDLIKSRLDVDDLAPLSQLMEQAGLKSFCSPEAKEAAHWWENLKRQRIRRGGQTWTSDPLKQDKAKEYYLRNRNAILSHHKLRYQTDEEYRQKMITRSRRNIEHLTILRRMARERKEALGCKECGVRNPACLDFHHTNPSQKCFTIGSPPVNCSKERFLAEMEKCQVLCANCHRILHSLTSTA